MRMGYFELQAKKKKSEMSNLRFSQKLVKHSFSYPSVPNSN